MSEILRDLNPEQKKAVECIEGPMLIVAGAGSGKTRVLTSRIAYLIEKGIPPERILSLTFTKKAAGEMKERIALMVGERQARKIWMAPSTPSLSVSCGSTLALSASRPPLPFTTPRIP